MALFLSGCRAAPPPPPLNAQVAGSMVVAGISAPVRIIRDRWGVPHVYAESRDDLFFAQGFVQAEDRLFQMELWRRSAEGKLAEVLGANFIERDAMTRRLQYRGDAAAEWKSYGADTKRMAEAFVRGVNAWIALARERAPELFAVAGWPVVFWTADDLLTRTDAFDRDGTIAEAESQHLPDAVVDSVRRAAAPAFFTGLARSPSPLPAKAAPDQDRSNDTATSALTLPSPSPYYLIHLHTPAWNAIGAAVPWRPGIVLGHDGTATFALADVKARARVRAAALETRPEQVEQDVILVKGRSEPFLSQTQITPDGVVIATDRAGGKQFVMKWVGHQAGTAPAFAPSRPPHGEPPFGERPTQLPPPIVPIKPAGSHAVFRHPLAITALARARYDVGPVAVPAGEPSPFFVQPDRRVWDATRAMSAPGQSEDPGSAHFADLARLWSEGHAIALAYSDTAVTANGEAMLALVPDPRR